MRDSGEPGGLLTGSDNPNVAKYFILFGGGLPSGRFCRQTGRQLAQQRQEALLIVAHCRPPLISAWSQSAQCITHDLNGGRRRAEAMPPIRR
jgi:hypothetical protein